MADSTAPLELPIGVTESKVLQQIARIESQLRKMQNSAAQNFVKSNQQVAKSFAPIATAAQGMSRSATASLQNVSFQLQDIFVQISSGTAPSRALSQQLPQLLSGFGTMGIVAGTAAAALIPLIANLISTGDEAANADKAMDGLEGAFKAYSDYVKIATTDTSKLIEEYGRFSGEIRDMSRMMAEISVGGIRDKARAALEPIKGELAEIQSWQDAIEREQARMDESLTGSPQWALAREHVVQYGDELDRISARIGLTSEQALLLAEKMDAAFNATSLEEMASASIEAVNTFERMEIPLLSLSPPLREALAYLDQMAKASAKAATESEVLNDWLNTIKLTLSDMWEGVPAEGWLSGPISDAMQLARAFWEAARAKAAALAAGPQAGAVAGKGPAFEDRGRSRSTLPPSVTPQPTLDELIERDSKGRGGGGKGGGSGRTDPLLRITEDTANLEAQAAAFRDATAAGGDWQRNLDILEQKQRLLNQAQRDGIKVTPEYEAQITAAAVAYVDAKNAMEDLQEATQAGQNALETFFGSILEGADAAKKALADLLAEIAKVQFQKGLMGLLGAAGGGGLIGIIGGLLSNADGGVYSGAGISAYSGKVVSKPTVFPFAKGVGLMGEAGPEAILPLTRIGGKLGVRAEGSTRPPITFSIDARGAEAGVEERIEAAIRRAAPMIEQRAAGQAVATTFRRMRATKAGWA